MITPKLALRGLSRNRKSTLVLVGLVAAGAFLFLLGDSILGAASSGLREEFQNGYTGDAAVRARFERKFGIFGFSVPTIGEYEEMPVLPEAAAIREAAARVPGIEAAVPMVSGAALLQGPAGYEAKVPVFGVVAKEYFAFFPGLKFRLGGLPSDEGAWIILPSSRADEIEAATGSPLAIGDELQFTMASGSAFTIRAVKLAGIIEAPLKGQPELAAAYTDPTTLRALLGLSLGNAAPSPAGEEAPSLDIDSFFAASGEEAPSAKAGDASGTGGVRGLDLVSSYLEAGTAAQATPEVDVDKGAWHFLLLRFRSDANRAAALKSFNVELSGAGIGAEAVDWLSVAGLNASILFVLKTVFEIGLGVLAGVVVLVLTNGLAFSVIEQTKEIGSMRAMGAFRAFVARLYFLQSLAIVAMGVVLGSLAAWLVLLGIGRVGIPITNSYLYMLFGVSVLRPSFMPAAALAALAAAVVVAGIASIYPMVLAMRTSIAQTMSAE